MQDIVLFCKSYKKDFLRLRRLVESISKYNRDDIPLYISTPANQRHELQSVLFGFDNYKWIADEEIITSNPGVTKEMYEDVPGQWAQAIIKAEFWRLRHANTYLCLDSDCIFLKNFHRSDFLYTSEIPYTVMHQNKDFFQIALNRNKDKVVENLESESQRVKELFGRKGLNYYCAPAPFIWSSKVWESFDREYLLPSGRTIWQVLTSQYPETLVYGEALLKYRAIPLYAIEPLFRVYHYDWHYYIQRRMGETLQKVRQIYLGVIFQSNWEVELNYGSPAKYLASRVWKKIKRLLRLLESYF